MKIKSGTKRDQFTLREIAKIDRMPITRAEFCGELLAITPEISRAHANDIFHELPHITCIQHPGGFYDRMEPTSPSTHPKPTKHDNRP